MAPTPCFVSTGFGKLLKAFKVALDSALNHSQRIAHSLDDAFGLVLDLKPDPRLVVRERLKSHEARVGCATRASPSDPLSRDLLCDVRNPTLVFACDFRFPTEGLVIELLDRFTPSMNLGNVSN